MGLLDVLADSRVPLLSIPASMMGGENAQSRLRNFAEREYPAIAQEFANATTEQGVNRAMQSFTQKSMQAGLKPDQMRELAKHLVEPALRNLGANEIGKLTGELRGQPAQPGFESEAQQMSVAPVPAVPGRDVNPADMFKMAEIEARTGVKAPAGFASMVSAPSQIAQREASAKMHEESQRKTAREIIALEARQKAIGGLPDTPVGNTGVSARALGHIGGLSSFVTNSMPGRPGSLDEERRGLIAAQTNAANARAGASGREGKGSQMMQDFVKQGGDPEDVDAFLGYTEKRTAATGRGSQSVSDPSYPSLDRETDLKSIAREAISLGKTKPEEIKAIAAKRGVILEGNPTVEGSGSKVGRFFGATEPTLTGDFEIKRKPRTTTRTSAGGATKGSDDPLGIRPKRK